MVNQIAQQSYHYTREILEKEVFPNKDPQYGSQITNMSILDLGSIFLRKESPIIILLMD